MSSRNLQRGRYSRVGHFYVLTTVVLHRRPVFVDPPRAGELINVLRFVESNGFSRSFAWVVMPDHLHWLMQLRKGTLADVMCLLKSRSGRLLCRQHGVDAPLWQPSYFDHAVRDEHALRRHARYIAENPVRAGLAARIGEYPYAWCRWPME